MINTKEALQGENDYDTLLKNKQEEMLALIMENAKAGEYTQEFDARYHAIAEEIQSIKENQTEQKRVFATGMTILLLQSLKKGLPILT